VLLLGLDRKALVWVVAHALSTLELGTALVAVGWREQPGLQKQPDLLVARAAVSSAMVLTETVHSEA
jgi:hypothetical protein